MAAITILTSDLSGAEGARRHTFGVDRDQFEIDLTDAEVAALKDALAPWMAVGRRISSVTGKPAKGKRKAADPRAAAIRQWAREKGYTVPERGRLPHYLVSEFEKEHVSYS